MKRHRHLTLVISVLWFATLGTAQAAVKPFQADQELRELRAIQKIPHSLSVATWAREEIKKGHTPQAESLLALAARKQLADRDRTLALLVAHQVDAPRVKERFKTLLPQLLSDSSWMVRSTALRLSPYTTSAQKLVPMLLPKLQDPALVVRWEALKTVAKLTDTTSSKALQDALTAALMDKRNYTTAGEPLWVPPLALELLLKQEQKNRAKDLSAQLNSLAQRKGPESWKSRLKAAAQRLP